MSSDSTACASEHQVAHRTTIGSNTRRAGYAHCHLARLDLFVHEDLVTESTKSAYKDRLIATASHPRYLPGTSDDTQQTCTTRRAHAPTICQPQDEVDPSPNCATAKSLFMLILCRRGISGAVPCSAREIHAPVQSDTLSGSNTNASSLLINPNHSVSVRLTTSFQRDRTYTSDTRAPTSCPQPTFFSSLSSLGSPQLLRPPPQWLVQGLLMQFRNLQMRRLSSAISLTACISRQEECAPPNSGNKACFGSFRAGASSDNRFEPATIILSVILVAFARIVPSPKPGYINA